jgi:hypothetical protein
MKLLLKDVYREFHLEHDEDCHILHLAYDSGNGFNEVTITVEGDDQQEMLEFMLRKCFDIKDNS